jgi:hypothetical protein
MKSKTEDLFIGLVICILLSIFVGVIVYCSYELSQQLALIQLGYYYG